MRTYPRHQHLAEDEDVQRVAIAAECLREEAVIVRVEHCGAAIGIVEKVTMA